MDKKALQKYIEMNPRLIAMRSAGNGIFVLKYKKRVFFDNLWNRFTEECRGTIVDKDMNIVSRPFTKIYNYGIEKNSPKLVPDTPVVAYRKINGFMVAMTWYKDDILVSTTGSTDSPFVALAKEQMLAEHSWDHWRNAVGMFDGYTLMFECVHPSDPHIIPEETGMYFLGWRKNDWDEKLDGYKFSNGDWAGYAKNILKVKFAESFKTTIGELVALSKVTKHEGFVFYTEDGQSAKIKTPHYLVSKFVARNPRTDKLMRPDIKQSIDEEYYPLIDAIQANIEQYTAMDEQTRLTWVREFLEAK